MSTQIDLGPVLSVPKGDWNATTTYERLNLVRHNSASWICNVATSTGVEPTEDSTDWYLQVKDTSSVSSVNGMRGDVVISDIATPDASDNSTKIANTEWVTDHATDVLETAKTYTDTSISDAATSILETAANDAANKATIAVNQALASAGDKYLSKSGGEMSGAILLKGNTLAQATTNTSHFALNGGDGWGSGGRLTLYGNNCAFSPGCAKLTACDSDNNENALVVYPDGTATVDRYEIMTAKGGTMNGSMLFDMSQQNGINAITAAHSNGYMQFCGGTGYAYGATLALYGAGYSGQDGSFLLRACDYSANIKTLLGAADGRLQWGGENLVRSINGITANSAGNVVLDTSVTSVNGMTGAVTIDIPVTSVNGMTGAVTVEIPVTSVDGMTGAVSTASQSGTDYIRLANGLQLCWATVQIPAGTSPATWTFPKSFVRAPRVSATTIGTNENFTEYFASPTLVSNSATSIKVRQNWTTQTSFHVIAVGYWK